MKLISHRGNINGPHTDQNSEGLIVRRIEEGYEVEIDIWRISSKLFLGHDKPEKETSKEFLISNSKKLWVHCKNIESLAHLIDFDLNVFFHTDEDVVLTSKGNLWTFPGKKVFPNSILVLPEIQSFEKIPECFGICSDYIERYR